MDRVIKDTCYKGTRILLGNTKRDLLNTMIYDLRLAEYKEISIPIIQLQDMFSGKVGEENTQMMFKFQDMKPRDLVLAPEYTAVIQRLAKTTFKHDKDVKLFYVQECFRGENPQAGRYRQFTQLGVEIINPTKPYLGELTVLATDLIGHVIPRYRQDLQLEVTRGLDYYVEGQGFEISCHQLGSSKQVCGGGQYEGGIGFAIGIDRLLLYDKNAN